MSFVHWGCRVIQSWRHFWLMSTETRGLVSMTVTHEPLMAPWVCMWGLALGIYAALKSLSWWNCTAVAPVWKHAAYLLAWPGMDADTFLRVPSKPVPSVPLSEWCFASGKFIAGLMLLWVVIPQVTHAGPVFVGVLGMVGVALSLHFGLFHLLSCTWRHWNIPAAPIMNRPLLSHSLAEFWGRRWNLAFRDLTHRFLFLPLLSRCGAVGALLIGFLVSGVIHDLVISWPADGGYGLPTIYFMLQGMGVVVERSTCGRRLGLGQGLPGRLFCVACILMASPLLFHRPFLERVVVPFLSAIGSIR